MNQNDISSQVRETLHVIKAYLSPITTFVELERKGLSIPERDLLIMRADEGLKMVVNEVDQLSLRLKSEVKA